MKVVILAGGMGTRLSEETDLKPKPMVEIGEKPMLWHIMKLYSHYGYNDFIICLGYKGYLIKEYFANYFLHQADVTIDMKTNKMEVHHRKAEPWKVTLVDTGVNTMTGGRIKRVEKYIGGKPFLLTYGDGLSDVNIKDLVAFHKKSGKSATLTAIQTLGRFGALEINARGGVNSFREKPPGDGAWINGGFFVLEPRVLGYIGDDSTIWERGPLERLARENSLGAYKHKGFWKCMDTLRDKQEFEKLWRDKAAPWRKS
ncbi:MAG: glucose-1-phosphate cytidylyltransferase [Elusimicrobia bacterium GWA2_56_46]|nr:MAG: glucose-1-phosphate cytidylyltransferase [Elusimicrobia bacterium GWA2_56_46]OGR53697.1 MAG: glucose-1-phosphate cytidylyltransferase [Elusimicrobia bacterium GWC2_56_31]HBB66817.1 glucose-1-phosphate cytidylyltransferase [Elusimicrobiota bacterium]HBW23164.1 glucose-1-phosphate cytidylyltransferase [Elusimicrobiota bacterium]